MMNYAIVLNEGHFTCLKENSGSWRLEPINGEESLVCSREEHLQDAAHELQTRLEYKPAQYVIILYSASFRTILHSLTKLLDIQQLIVLPLEQWLLNSGQSGQTLPLSERYSRHILPLICQQLSVQEATIKTLQLQAAAGESKALEEQLQSEQQENLALRAELKEIRKRMQQQSDDFKKYLQEQPSLPNHLDSLDTHTVAQFMPLFFLHFWQKVSASDFAMLMGTLDVPVINSPYPEPDRGILVMKKREFLQHKLHHQQQIRSMVLRFLAIGYFSLRPEAEPLMNF